MRNFIFFVDIYKYNDKFTTQVLKRKIYINIYVVIKTINYLSFEINM